MRSEGVRIRERDFPMYFLKYKISQLQDMSIVFFAGFGGQSISDGRWRREIRGSLVHWTLIPIKGTSPGPPSRPRARLLCCRPTRAQPPHGRKSLAQDHPRWRPINHSIGFVFFHDARRCTLPFVPLIQEHRSEWTSIYARPKAKLTGRLLFGGPR